MAFLLHFLSLNNGKIIRTQTMAFFFHSHFINTLNCWFSVFFSSRNAYPLCTEHDFITFTGILLCSFFLFIFQTSHFGQHLAFERQQLFLFDLNNLLFCSCYFLVVFCPEETKNASFFSSFFLVSECECVRWLYRTYLLCRLNANKQTSFHLVCFPHPNVSRFIQY